MLGNKLCPPCVAAKLAFEQLQVQGKVKLEYISTEQYGHEMVVGGRSSTGFVEAKGKAYLEHQLEHGEELDAAEDTFMKTHGFGIPQFFDGDTKIRIVKPWVSIIDEIVNPDDV